MRRIDLDRPLEDRKHYEVKKGRCNLFGKRYHYTDIYYDGLHVIEVFDTPEEDGTYRIRLTYSDLGHFRLAHCWNLVFRKMNIDAQVTKAKVVRVAHHTGDGFHIADGDEISFDKVWLPTWFGETRYFYATRDKHIRGSDSCMCSKCLAKDTECQDNSSSSTKDSKRKLGRSSKSFPNLSTTLPTHIFKR